MREPSEDELDRWMARLAQGDRSAFEPLFRALHPRAIRFARARLGPDLAADAAQSSMERVFARASEFTPGRPVLPWFYAVVANEVRALARRHSARDVAALGAPTSEWKTSPDDPERLVLERELYLALERAIASLDNSSAEVIAAVLGRVDVPALNAPAFRKRVSRAYARLRLLLGGFDGE
ncbi:MAG: RNA polymerase sigma factor [Polyangiaceae bacterium]|nr:RNA polymerase sigma factor [Polyangiaceae bacterium]